MRFTFMFILWARNIRERLWKKRLCVAVWCLYTHRTRKVKFLIFAVYTLFLYFNDGWFLHIHFSSLSSHHITESIKWVCEMWVLFWSEEKKSKIKAHKYMKQGKPRENSYIFFVVCIVYTRSVFYFNILSDIDRSDCERTAKMTHTYRNRDRVGANQKKNLQMNCLHYRSEKMSSFKEITAANLDCRYRNLHCCL